MGRAGDHAKWEAGWPAAYEKNKSPYSYIALVSVTGPNEVWYVSPLASQAALRRQPGSRRRRSRVARGARPAVARRRGVRERVDLAAGAGAAGPELWQLPGPRDDAVLGDHHLPGEARPRGRLRSGRQGLGVGHGARSRRTRAGGPTRWWRALRAAPTSCSRRTPTSAPSTRAATDGEATFKGLSFDERTTLDTYFRDAALSTVTNRYRLDPGQSFVPAETRQKDPAFWTPKPRPRRRLPRRSPDACVATARAPNEAGARAGSGSSLSRPWVARRPNARRPARPAGRGRPSAPRAPSG